MRSRAPHFEIFLIRGNLNALDPVKISTEITLEASMSKP